MKTIDVLVVEANPEDVLFLKQLARKISSIEINIHEGKPISGENQFEVKESIDVILISYGRSKEKGLAMLDEFVRSHPKIPIVMLSNFDDAETSLLTLQKGAQDYLVKDQINEHSFPRSLIFAVQRKQKEERLEYLATHDYLTNLPNRWLFGNRLQRGIKRFYRKTDGLSLAILFVDLDQFKSVNDTYGHHAGDQVLSLLAERLKMRLRENDTVARLGGDEFSIILEGITDEDIGIKVAQDILNLIREPFQIEDQSITVSASIGISFYPQHGQDVTLLLDRADQAMYRAKSSKEKIRIYQGVDLPEG